MADYYRIMAIDPGEKRIGIALSDLSRMVATPLTVIKHVQREKDALNILELANQHEVQLILVGQALDSEGYPSHSARKSARLAASIQSITKIQVKLWDESSSTDDAVQNSIAMGVKRKKRIGHLDDVAAAVILQSYLDSVEYGTTLKAENGEE